MMYPPDLLKGKRVLVTGGTGFIGSHLIDFALQSGAVKVIAYDNLIASNIENVAHCFGNQAFELVRGDVRDYERIEKYVKNSDVILHNAASKMVAAEENPRIDLEVNITGTFNILQAARGSDVRIIHASTGSVLGSYEEAMTEEHPRRPTTLYGISKTAGESYVQYFAKECGVKATVIRYFHVYGPRQDYSHEAGVISIFIERVLKGQPPVVYSGGSQIRCFTYVGDVVNANMLLLSRPESIGQTYNVASKVRISIKDLAQLIIDRYAENPLQIEMGKHRIGENYKPIPDTEKIEKLGFRPGVDLEEGLELTKKYVESLLDKNKTL